MSEILNKAVEERRKILLQWLYRETKGEVLYGPFKGMKISSNFCWGDGDTGAKLLGIYENEIFACLQQCLDEGPDLVINYGCAEGYYGVGIGRLLPNTKIVFVDVEQRALDISKENSDLNSLKNCEYLLGGGQQKLQTILSQAEKPFLLMDCEGAEDYLLDLDIVPALSKTDIILEVHEFMSAGMTDRLVYKFNETHILEGIIQGTKDYHIEPITVLGDLDKLILNNENRPNTMNWIYMRVKK